MSESHPSEHDVIIIGGGAAGLTAALLLARSRRDVVVIDGGEPRNAPAQHMRGYLSGDGMAPADLLAAGREEVTSYGGRIVSGTVIAVTVEHEVVLDSGERYRGRRVVVATGVTDVLPDIPGVAERWGRDVLHCPYCHGLEVADHHLVVLGTNPGGGHHALMLRQWSDRVTYLPHVQEVPEPLAAQLAARGVDVVPGEVTDIVIEDDRVTGVRTANGVQACDAVFLPPQMRPRDGFLADLGCDRDERGFLQVDAQGRTSVDWIYAAGNSADPRAQVITAAGQGSSVGFALNLDLVMADTAAAMSRNQMSGNQMDGKRA